MFQERRLSLLNTLNQSPGRKLDVPLGKDKECNLARFGVCPRVESLTLTLSTPDCDQLHISDVCMNKKGESSAQLLFLYDGGCRLHSIDTGADDEADCVALEGGSFFFDEEEMLEYLRPLESELREGTFSFIRWLAAVGGLTEHMIICPRAHTTPRGEAARGAHGLNLGFYIDAPDLKNPPTCIFMNSHVVLVLGMVFEELDWSLPVHLTKDCTLRLEDGFTLSSFLSFMRSAHILKLGGASRACTIMYGEKYHDIPEGSSQEKMWVFLDSTRARVKKQNQNLFRRKKNGRLPKVFREFQPRRTTLFEISRQTGIPVFVGDLRQTFDQWAGFTHHLIQVDELIRVAQDEWFFSMKEFQIQGEDCRMLSKAMGIPHPLPPCDIKPKEFWLHRTDRGQPCTIQFLEEFRTKICHPGSLDLGTLAHQLPDPMDSTATCTLKDYYLRLYLQCPEKYEYCLHGFTDLTLAHMFDSRRMAQASMMLTQPGSPHGCDVDTPATPPPSSPPPSTPMEPIISSSPEGTPVPPQSPTRYSVMSATTATTPLAAPTPLAATTPGCFGGQVAGESDAKRMIRQVTEDLQKRLCISSDSFPVNTTAASSVTTHHRHPPTELKLRWFSDTEPPHRLQHLRAHFDLISQITGIQMVTRAGLGGHLLVALYVQMCPENPFSSLEPHLTELRKVPTHELKQYFQHYTQNIFRYNTSCDSLSQSRDSIPEAQQFLWAQCSMFEIIPINMDGGTVYFGPEVWKHGYQEPDDLTMAEMEGLRLNQDYFKTEGMVRNLMNRVDLPWPVSTEEEAEEQSPQHKRGKYSQ